MVKSSASFSCILGFDTSISSVIVCHPVAVVTLLVTIQPGDWLEGFTSKSVQNLNN